MHTLLLGIAALTAVIMGVKMLDDYLEKQQKEKSRAKTATKTSPQEVPSAQKDKEQEVVSSIPISETLPLQKEGPPLETGKDEVEELELDSSASISETPPLETGKDEPEELELGSSAPISETPPLLQSVPPLETGKDEPEKLELDSSAPLKETSPLLQSVPPLEVAKDEDENKKLEFISSIPQKEVPPLPTEKAEKQKAEKQEKLVPSIPISETPPLQEESPPLKTEEKDISLEASMDEVQELDSSISISETPSLQEELPPLETEEDKEQELKPVSPIPLKEEIVVPDKIFISHHSRDKVWLENLARNLKKIGYHVFLYIWETEPPFKAKIDNALDNCHKAILVVSQDAIESGWVREEYEWMLNRQQNDPAFTFIPVINEISSYFPFISDKDAINFSTENYFEAFHRLVCHFDQKSFNESDLELPSQTVIQTTKLTNPIHNFIDTLFTQFEQTSPPPLILLAQMDQAQTQIVKTILTKAQTRYQEGRYLHIALPYNTTANTQDCFSVFAQQCGFSETVNNGIEFEKTLRIRLDHTNPLFLFVSSFENGAASTQQQIAGICRSLNETHPHHIHIIFYGGEKLIKFKYQHGRDSLLNIAQDYRYPELERADVYAARDSCCQTLHLEEHEADKLLALSGGHPILLQKSLQLYQNSPTLTWQDYPQALSTEPLLWQLFSNLTRNSAETEQVREWLAQPEDIAPSLYLFSSGNKRNELLQRLYWKNLLVERRMNRNKRLCWRCEALRLAGNHFFS
jgi:hypothetical protein